MEFLKKKKITKNYSNKIKQKVPAYREYIKC